MSEGLRGEIPSPLQVFLDYPAGFVIIRIAIITITVSRIFLSKLLMILLPPFSPFDVYNYTVITVYVKRKENFMTIFLRKYNRC